MRRARRPSAFVDPQSRERFLTSYEAMLEDWPSHDTVEVAGSYGKTAVLTAGSSHAPDLVLLHGRYSPSPSWAPLIGGLAAHYRVHAIDTICEPGLSRNDGTPLRTRADYTAWLAETFDSLGLDAAHLCGHSFGGWLAARFAVDHPGRVASLTLLDPAQVFAPFTLSWLLRCVPPFLFPTAGNVRRLFRWLSRGLHHDDIVELATLGMLTFRIRSTEATRLSAGDLRSLPAPTQQLIAEQSVVHSPRRALRTAARAHPTVTSRLVPDSSHFLFHDQPARVLEAIHDLIGITGSRGAPR